MQITASFLLSPERRADADALRARAHAAAIDTSHVLAVNLPVMSYGKTPEQVHEFYREAQRRISNAARSRHVADGFSVPWRDDQGLSISFAFAAQGAHAQERAGRLRAKFRSVSPGFFATMGVPHR